MRHVLLALGATVCLSGCAAYDPYGPGPYGGYDVPVRSYAPAYGYNYAPSYGYGTGYGYNAYAPAYGYSRGYNTYYAPPRVVPYTRAPAQLREARREYRQERREDRREFRQDRREDRREFRQDRREFRAERGHASREVNQFRREVRRRGGG